MAELLSLPPVASPGAALGEGPDAPSSSIFEMLDALAVPAYAHRGEKILHANAAMLRLSGHTLSWMQDCLHGALAVEPWREELHLYGMACYSRSEEPPALGFGLRHAQGDERSVEIAARRLVRGGLSTVIVTCQDLSDIQHVQSSMLNLSQVLNQIINGGPLATFVIDAERHVTHWNRACQLMTGIPAWQMLGRSDTWRAFYGQAQPLLADLIAQACTPEQLLAAYPAGIHPSDTVPGAYEGVSEVPNMGATQGERGLRWLYFSAAPLHDAQGVLIGAVQTMQDVTERHHAEQELLRHRNQLEQLVAERSAELRRTVDQLAAFMENSPVGAVHIVDGTVTHHNRVLAAMLGCPGHSLVGRRGAEFFPTPQAYGALVREAVPLLQQGLPLHREVWMEHTSGALLWVQVIAYAADFENPAAGTWWLVQDRTEFRRTQDELQQNFERIKETNQKLEDAQNQLLQQDKMASIGALAAGVAHEINNPIGFVGSNLFTLRTYAQDMLALISAYESTEAPAASEQAQQTLAAVKRRVEIDYLREDLPKLLDESDEGLGRVKRIVQDLKDFSRVDQDAWQEADLNAGLESTLNVVMHEVKYKATIERHLQTLPRVRCLAAQLNQVFMNLIVNASQAITAASGVITLSSGHVSTPQGGWVWVEVGDTGSGMSEGVMKRVFEPFFTTKAVGKGTGLGLSLSFSIVQRHGGVMRVRSVLGQGSAFKVWVPVNGPDAGGAALTPPPED